MFGIYCPLRPLAQIGISLAAHLDMYQIIYPKNLTTRHSLNRLDIVGVNGVFCGNLAMRIHTRISFQTNLEILN